MHDYSKAVWVPVEGNPKYEVNQFGQIRSLRYGKSLELNSKGYVVMSAPYDETRTKKDGHKQVTRRVADIVLEAFTGEDTTGMTVTHLDGNKRNNALDNLEVADTQVYRYTNGRQVPVDTRLNECWKCGATIDNPGRYARLCGTCYEDNRRETGLQVGDTMRTDKFCPKCHRNMGPKATRGLLCFYCKSANPTQPTKHVNIHGPFHCYKCGEYHGLKATASWGRLCPTCFEISNETRMDKLLRTPQCPRCGRKYNPDKPCKMCERLYGNDTVKLRR